MYGKLVVQRKVCCDCIVGVWQPLNCELVDLGDDGTRFGDTEVRRGCLFKYCIPLNLFRVLTPQQWANTGLLLHQSGVTMVGGTLGPLTATEARAFNDVVGEFGASDGGV